MLFRLRQELGIILAISRPWTLVSAAERGWRSLLGKFAVFRGVLREMEDHVASREHSYLPTPALAGLSQNGEVCEEDGLLQNAVHWMAVPKKRTSHSKKRMRMTHKWLKPIHHYTFCRNCGSPKLLHMLCGQCFKETMKKTAEYRRIEEQRRLERREARKLKRVTEGSRPTDNANTM